MGLFLLFTLAMLVLRVFLWFIIVFLVDGGMLFSYLCVLDFAFRLLFGYCFVVCVLCVFLLCFHLLFMVVYLLGSIDNTFVESILGFFDGFLCCFFFLHFLY